jgi:HAD superfamily hydrolase (TIGR01509 family)
MLRINGHQVAGVIFDIDGTLVDSFATLVSVLNIILKKYQLDPVSEEFLASCFRRNMNLGETLHENYSSSFEEPFIETLRSDILDLFLKVEVEEVKPFPGVDRLFEKLKTHQLKIGIATGRMSPPENEWARFRRYGLEKYLNALVTSREVEQRKPSPDAIIECARRLEIPLGQSLVVGDTASDIIAARRAGAIAVAVSTGQDSLESLKSQHPELLFENLEAFSLFLDKETDRS